MDLLMRLQMAMLFKSGIALGARIGSLVCVFSYLMLFQIALDREGFVAELTNKWLISCMDPLMDVMTTHLLEALVTVSTVIQRLILLLGLSDGPYRILVYIIRSWILYNFWTRGHGYTTCIKASMGLRITHVLFPTFSTHLLLYSPIHIIWCVFLLQLTPTLTLCPLSRGGLGCRSRVIDGKGRIVE